MLHARTLLPCRRGPRPPLPADARRQYPAQPRRLTPWSSPCRGRLIALVRVRCPTPALTPQA